MFGKCNAFERIKRGKKRRRGVSSIFSVLPGMKINTFIENELGIRKRLQ